MLKILSFLLCFLIPYSSKTNANTLDELFESVLNGDIQKIGTISKKESFDINQTNKKGETALHLAARYGEIKSCKALLKYGARVDIADHNNSYPIHEASWFGNVKTLKMLLKNDTSLINKQDILGWSPLFYAVMSLNFGKNAQKCINLLLKHEAHVDLVDKGGNTIIHYISQHGYSRSLLQLCKYLMKKNLLTILQKKNAANKTALNLINQYKFPRSYNILKKYGA